MDSRVDDVLCTVITSAKEVMFSSALARLVCLFVW